jgi:microcystin-dependent protein
MELCKDADKNTIPATDAGTSGLFSEQYGWQNINSLPLSAGGIAPNRRDFNGAFNLLGGIAFYAQKGFTFNFDTTQEYFAGCVVIDATDGKRYECIADVAAGGSVPSADATHWKEFRLGGDGFDVGDIKIIAYNGSIPDKWFLCDGSAVSRDLYANLYSKIGTTYGSGDGSTTFNLPNFVDKFAEGSTTAGTVKQAGLPNITGTAMLRYGINSARIGLTVSGSISSQDKDYSNTYQPISLTGTTTAAQELDFDASQSNAIYGASTTVQPPALTMRFLIKYEE